MNKNIEAVFEMLLDVEPNEEFGIRFPDNSISGFKYRIDESFNGESFDDGKNQWDKEEDFEEVLKKLITGRYTIIKQLKFTEAEQKMIEVCKMLGAKYIAKNYDGTVYFYEDIPSKKNNKYAWVNTRGVNSFKSHRKLKFNSLNWSDEEPYYIGD